MKLNIQEMYDYLVMGAARHKKRGPYLRQAIFLVLNETQAELKRLLQHPGLIPDGASQMFFQEMNMLLRKVVYHLRVLQAARQRRQIESQNRTSEYRRQLLPEYDESRTAWQQFLHRHAPGSGIPKDQMDEHGCTQMITAACSLMSSNRRDEHEDFAHYLEMVRLNP